MQTTLPLACFLSMIRPPGVQFEDALLQIAPVDKAKCPFVRDHNDIGFRLYTKHNPTVYQELMIDDDEKLFASNIDFHLPTVIHFHAFMETPDDGSPAAIREAYIQRGDTNIILVDASRLEAGPWYFTAAENTWYIGNFAAKFIDYLVSRGLDLKKTHLTGHSLGGQSAGVAGFAIKSGRVARITAMDPALPLFYGLPEEQRLDKSDAEFVDVIHTDSGIFGFNQPLGHVDFYPNGGISPQPGCELEVVIPQHLLLNKCDSNTPPRGLYTYYLTPNRSTSTQRLQNIIQKLFHKIHTSTSDGKDPIRVSKKGAILASNTTPKEEEDQIMIESVKYYRTVPYFLAIRNKYEETGTMKPIYKDKDNTETDIEELDKTHQITVKESTYQNTENKDDSGLHKDNVQTNYQVEDHKNRKFETETTNDQNYNKETVKTEHISTKETTTKTQPLDIDITKQNQPDSIHTTHKGIFKKLYSVSKKNIQTKEHQKDTTTKKPIKDEESSTIETKKQKTTNTNQKRQKRFINPFRRTEEEIQQNFLFRILDFVFKHGRNIPVYSVMREINTLVKSAQGELNHVTKERNNFIGAPPPLIPVTYSLELGNENKAVAFMKRLLGFPAKGDRLTISGNGK